MATISVDLAYKDYRDIGVVALAKVGPNVEATAIRLQARGLVGVPSAAKLVDALLGIAAEANAKWIFIDGPQAWKAADGRNAHARCCERELSTQGKTGLPGFTKPANYLGFTSFAIEVFDKLAQRDWPRLAATVIPPHRIRCAVESFPTSAWRSLGIAPLPGKASTLPEHLRNRLGSLRQAFPLVVGDDLSHDELQALVSGLAGLALESGNPAGVRVVGEPPVESGGSWREGFIVNPTRHAAA